MVMVFEMEDEEAKEVIEKAENVKEKAKKVKADLKRLFFL